MSCGQGRPDGKTRRAPHKGHRHVSIGMSMSAVCVCVCVRLCIFTPLDNKYVYLRLPTGPGAELTKGRQGRLPEEVTVT